MIARSLLEEASVSALVPLPNTLEANMGQTPAAGSFCPVRKPCRPAFSYHPRVGRLKVNDDDDDDDDDDDGDNDVTVVITALPWLSPPLSS